VSAARPPTRPARRPSTHPAAGSVPTHPHKRRQTAASTNDDRRQPAQQYWPIGLASNKFIWVLGRKTKIYAGHIDGTYRETDGRQTITLCFQLAAASVTMQNLNNAANASTANRTALGIWLSTLILTFGCSTFSGPMIWNSLPDSFCDMNRIIFPQLIHSIGL